MSRENRENRSFDHEWSDEERARLRAFGNERTASPELKDRTIAALQSRRLLEGKSRVRFPMPVVIGMLLAATIVFVAGALVGYAAANRRTVEPSQPSVAVTRAVARVDSVDSVVTGRHVVWY